MKLKKRILPYYQAVPRLLLFQVISMVILPLLTKGVSALCNLLLGIAGKAAFTSGDIGFLFTHWQGYVIIVLVILLVICYVAIEINALMIYCRALLDREKPSVFKSIRDGFAAMRKYCCPRGAVLIIYAVFLSPLLGFGFSITLTGSFYIPRFIMSVIMGKPVFFIVYIIVMAALTVYIILNCFVLHGSIFNGMKLKYAGAASARLVKRHIKNFIPEMLIFLGLEVLVTGVLAAVFGILPLLIIQSIPMGETVALILNIFFSLLLVIILLLSAALAISFLMIKLTILYRKYRSDGKWEYRKKEKKRHPVIITAIVLVAAACVGLSVAGANNFDAVFRPEIKTEIIGHRCGGFDAPENTVKGIETAYELGAYGCETDIQRTADGYYVINHDTTFARVAGVDKKPSEMTLEEVKELRVDGEPVPTLEELLEASRDKVILFVELKGETVDKKMADDAVRIIKEMGMEDQTVLISLKYGALDYIERKYPEMQTGYLTFISFGRIEDTPFDYLALEEEISTTQNINAIHAKGKKIMVWTVNDQDNIERFMTSGADAIITDSVKLSAEIRDQLKNRGTMEIVLQELFSLVFR